jgi:hypothetical protein
MIKLQITQSRQSIFGEYKRSQNQNLKSPAPTKPKYHLIVLFTKIKGPDIFSYNKLAIWQTLKRRECFCFFRSLKIRTEKRPIKQSSGNH